MEQLDGVYSDLVGAIHKKQQVMEQKLTNERDQKLAQLDTLLHTCDSKIAESSELLFGLEKVQSVEDPGTYLLVPFIFVYISAD